MRQQRGLCVALTTEMITTGLAHVELAKHDNRRSTVIHTSQPSKQTPHRAWKHVSGSVYNQQTLIRAARRQEIRRSHLQMGKRGHVIEDAVRKLWDLVTMERPVGRNETRKYILKRAQNNYKHFCLHLSDLCSMNDAERFHWNREGSFQLLSVGGWYFWQSFVQLVKICGSASLEKPGVKFLRAFGWQGQQEHKGGDGVNGFSWHRGQ